MSRDERPSRSETASGYGPGPEGSGPAMYDEPETIRFGCSMLSRIRLKPRRPGDMTPWRCALGYAVPNDEAAAKCLAVEGPGECWKAAPSWRVAPPEPRPRRQPAPPSETVQESAATKELIPAEPGVAGDV